MIEKVLTKLEERDKEKLGDESAEKENLFIEILKEGEECPNCHFALLKREGNEIFCPICAYGRKACT